MHEQSMYPIFLYKAGLDVMHDYYVNIIVCLFLQVNFESWRWFAASSTFQKTEELQTREAKAHFILP